MAEWISDENRCKQCVHYEKSDNEYDFCHECKMEVDHFKARKPSTDV